jgi:nicotinamide-nucleotide amidase
VAQALAATGGEGDGVAATICARDFEIHVDLIVEERGRERADELAAALREHLGRWLFAEDERPVGELVLDVCRARGLSLAVAESCTGGLVAARLTSVPGASDVFAGGIVPYSNELKRALLGVSAELLERHGAVSAEAAAAMASGARGRLGADVAVAVTGVAGPRGGTPEKPVGLVHLHAEAPDASRGLELRLPGDRDAVRGRATAAALHLVRELLTRNRHEDA